MWRKEFKEANSNQLFNHFYFNTFSLKTQFCDFVGYGWQKEEAGCSEMEEKLYIIKFISDLASSSK